MENKKSSSIDGMTLGGTPVEQIPSFTSGYISSIPPQTTEECKIQPKQYGWECPKCGAVMSPDQKTCPFCAPPFTIKTYY